VEAVFGKTIGNNLDLLYELGGAMLEQQELKALLITRGRDGMALFERGKKPQIIPVFGSDQAVDVTGAGDTVGAVFTLAIAAGAGFSIAALLANCAGGLVVMKRGTATVTARELKEAIRNA
jgi:D-glycero-beta-D-manno-heptose-7-phosphate kinase